MLLAVCMESAGTHSCSVHRPIMQTREWPLGRSAYPSCGISLLYPPCNLVPRCPPLLSSILAFFQAITNQPSHCLLSRSLYTPFLWPFLPPYSVIIQCTAHHTAPGGISRSYSPLGMLPGAVGWRRFTFGCRPICKPGFNFFPPSSVDCRELTSHEAKGGRGTTEVKVCVSGHLLNRPVLWTCSGPIPSAPLSSHNRSPLDNQSCDSVDLMTSSSHKVTCCPIMRCSSPAEPLWHSRSCF